MLRKRKQQNRGRFDWVSAGGPDQDLFLVSQFKQPKEKTCFHSLVGMNNLLMGHFSRPKSPSRVKQDLFFFSRILVGHHFEIWDRPKRKLESANVAESDKT